MNNLKTLRSSLTMAVASIALLAACGESAETVTPAAEEVVAEKVMSTDAEEVQGENPLLVDWDTPHGIPPFSTFSEDDYMPAFKVALAELDTEVQALAASTDAPTFANTIEAMERGGASLEKVANVFFNITGTDTNDNLNAIRAEVSPMLSKATDAIFLNDNIWQRVNALYETRDSLNLDTDQLRVLELYHRDFTRRGAALDEASKIRMSEINAELSSLTTSFGQNLLNETKGFELHVTDVDQLGGLSDEMIAAAKATAERKGKEGYVFGLNRSVYEAFMTASTNRDLREKLFNGYTLRAANGGDTDNGKNILRIAQLRAEAAELRGYESHAHFQLETRMAKTPKQAEEFLLKVWRPGLVRAKQEIATMQAMVGDAYMVRASDWWHLSEKVRQEKYAFDASQLKPYFELSNVQAGAFYTAEQLFDISFKELEDTPRWNPEVTVYEVTDNASGEQLGIFMTDMYARDSKRGGAWMSSYRDASKLDGNVRPIITNNMNLSKPAGDAPTLIGFTEVSTLFHEFGHGLHGLMTQEKYSRTSGVSGPRDYTEFPAQMMEHWAAEADVLAKYATHYETGEVIPDALVEKMKNAANHNQGFKTTEFIAASLLDLRWHMLSSEEANKITDAHAFQKEVLAGYGLIPEIEPRYRSPYFSHIFAGGYSAGYYAYLWSEILDADGFEAFKEAGDIFDPTLAKRLRENVYEAGSREEADVLYRKFRGKDPSIEPLLNNRGLNDGS